MKRQYGKIMQRIAALMLGVFLMLGSVAQAFTNTATGDIASVPGDLGDSNTFTLLAASTPTLVKTAFLAGGGAALTTGDTLPSGTSIDFLIYLVNESSLDILDVSIQDALAGFAYTTTTIRVFNGTASSVCSDPTDCTAGEELIIYNDVRGTGLLDDAAAGGDSASFIGSQLDVGAEVQTANDVQDVSALTILAVVFTVTID